ncbi:MAG: acyl-CoA dehydrogenase family protein [Marmoricola sp.]
MHFARTEEQDELATTVRSLLAKRADSSAVRKALESEAGYDLDLWTALVEQIGVTALPIPEEFDGFGASLVETAIVLEELGYALAPTPLLASALNTAQALLAGEDAQLLGQLAAGEVRPFSLGDVVLEPTTRIASMDQTLRLGRGDGTPLTPEMSAIAAALISALQVGVMQRGLDMTVAYSKERVQFGREIGSFQALKHRMADMLVLVEAARSASWAASYAAAAYVTAPSDDTRENLLREAAVARRWCNESGEKIASETVQLHGGIAITWEHDAHLVFKTLHALAHLL